MPKKEWYCWFISSLQSYQQWGSVPLSPHSYQHVLSLEFLTLAPLV
uniref:Uncharacterized protein n=1 Tax=Trichinella nativa TaxID=6335 RepID=A0A0V1KHY3_9BILA